MHQVERAIILAAGMGKRMQPITKNVPKPLVRVNGRRMIDTVISGLQKNGIWEIYIVVGYLQEKFKCLENEYEGIKLIENPYYERCNNISSLYVAREHIKNAIILDGDQIILNDQVLSPEFEISGYNCVWTNKKTKEWILNLTNNRVSSCSRVGGNKGWQLFSISRWSEEDGEKLKRHLELEFEVKKNTQIYWDDVALFCFPEEYELGIRKMNFGDVIEVDDISELVELDNSYVSYINKEE